jgi:hypothetical protein
MKNIMIKKSTLGILFFVITLIVVAGCGKKSESPQVTFENFVRIFQTNADRSATFDYLDWDAIYQMSIPRYQREGIHSGAELRKSREEFLRDPGTAMMNRMFRQFRNHGKEIPQFAGLSEEERKAKESLIIEGNNKLFQDRIVRDKSKKFILLNVHIEGDKATGEVQIIDPDPNSRVKVKQEPIIFNKKNGKWLIVDSFSSSFGLLR